jgi:uncharacterized membrane protein
VNWDEIKLDPGTQIAPMGLSLRLYIGPEDIGKCDWTRHIVVYFFVLMLLLLLILLLLLLLLPILLLLFFIIKQGQGRNPKAIDKRDMFKIHFTMIGRVIFSYNISLERNVVRCKLLRYDVSHQRMKVKERQHAIDNNYAQ